MTLGISLLARNNEDIITASLETLLASDITQYPYHGTLIDNDSTDHTVERARMALGDHIAQWTIITLPENIGIPASRNLAFEMLRITTGDTLSYLLEWHTDALAPTDWFTSLLWGTQYYPDACIWCPRILSKSQVHVDLTHTWTPAAVTELVARHTSRLDNQTMTQPWLVDAEVFAEIGGYPLAFWRQGWDDWAFVLECTYVGYPAPFAQVPDSVIYHHHAYSRVEEPDFAQVSRRNSALFAQRYGRKGKNFVNRYHTKWGWPTVTDWGRS